MEERLRGVQRELDQKITHDLVMFEAELRREYRSILRQEEIMWYQKARDNRVRLGDRNTSYFHTQCVIRRKRNHIHRLKLDDGQWCSNEERLAEEVLGFFRKLFAEDTSMQETSMHHESFPSLSEAERQVLVQPVTKEEVRYALMSMKSFSAPGPVGFQPIFY